MRERESEREIEREKQRMREREKCSPYITPAFSLPLQPLFTQNQIYYFSNVNQFLDLILL